MGNYQIRVNRLDQLDDFMFYKRALLDKLGTMTAADQESNRRFYCQEQHIRAMGVDPIINLIKAYRWKDNQ